jgi:pimeloyl-ACP methyl ester carboxylesterase
VATYAVIHGAGDVGSSWDLVAAELRRRGHDVVAPDLPCDDESAGLPEYTQTVVDALGDSPDVALVAHSLGGFTAPLVATRRPVGLIVLASAMVPLPGEAAGDWWDNTGYAAAVADRPDDAGEIELFLQDVEPGLARASLAKSRDQAGTPMGEPWPLEAWPDVPTRFLIFSDDRWHPAEWMRGVVRDRLGIEPDEMPGSHGAYLSRPEELADRLDGYWRSTLDG